MKFKKIADEIDYIAHPTKDGHKLQLSYKDRKLEVHWDYSLNSENLEMMFLWFLKNESYEFSRKIKKFLGRKAWKSLKRSFKKKE